MCNGEFALGIQTLPSSIQQATGAAKYNAIGL